MRERESVRERERERARERDREREHHCIGGGGFSMAVNALKDKARRALYAIKKKIKNIEIPLTIWCKIFDSVIQPIARFGVHSVIRAT